jgi:PAS domain S-box-containing protein
MSIRSKLTIIFLLIAAVPLLLFSALTYTDFKNSLETNRLTQLKDLGVFRADRIAAYFAGLKSDIAMAQGFYNIKKNLPVLARLAGRPENPEFSAATRMLGEQLRQMQSVSEMTDIMLVGVDGRVAYANRHEHYLKDFSKGIDAERQALVHGESGIYFSEVYEDKTEDNRFEMLVCAPATGFDGGFIGVIAFEIDMTPVYNLIQDTTGLGSTGEVLVGRKMGGLVEFLNPLRHDPKAALLKKAKIGDMTAFPIQQAVQGRTGAGVAIDYRGVQVIAAWRYIPSLDWGLVAKIDTREAFADVINLRNLVLIILTIMIILGGIIAFTIAQSISLPIKKLSKGAEIIGSGNLDYKVGTFGRDEIGQLSRSFDKMTNDIKAVTASRDDLNREIAERRRAEEALRESELRLRAVAETTPVGIGVVDLSGAKFLYVNQAYEKAFGYEHLELIGRSTPDIYWKAEDRIKILGILEEQGYVADYEVMFKRKDGTPFWGLSSIQPITFDGRPALLGAFVDITEHKKRDDELHKLNKTLEALSKSSQAMTRTSDEQEFLNEVCRIIVEDCGYIMVWIGYAQDDEAKSIRPMANAGLDDGYLEKLNLTWADTVHGRGPTGTAIRTGLISQCRNMETDPEFLPWRDEAIKRGYASSICIPLSMYGKPFGAITIYSREPDSFSESEARLLVELTNDLAYGITTIRLRAAQAKAEESLRNEHNFVSTILQTTGGLIVGFDPSGRIKIFNHSCERATGYTFCEVKDRVFWDFLLVPEEVEAVRVVFGNLSNLSKQSEFENYWVARDGARRFIRWTNSAILDKEGNVDLVIGTGIDITERKQTEIELERYKTDLERLVRERTAALRASEEQLIKANEMKLLGQLTSGVAHEVRNPLNGIIAIMGALSKELSDSDHFQPYMQHMRNQVTRLTVLMEDLLMLGRPLLREKMVKVPFEKFVRDAIATWQEGQQDNRSVLLDFGSLGEDGRLNIWADTVRLEQVVINLLDNAHQHSPADKPVEISVRDSGKGEVLFSVTDYGPGIPADVVPRIFEPFFTTRKGGTGLGLSIVRHVVESHGGSINVFNNEGRTGATFEVRLSLAKPRDVG